MHDIAALGVVGMVGETVPCHTKLAWGTHDRCKHSAKECSVAFPLAMLAVHCVWVCVPPAWHHGLQHAYLKQPATYSYGFQVVFMFAFAWCEPLGLKSGLGEFTRSVAGA